MRATFVFNTNWLAWEDVSQQNIPLSQLQSMPLALLFTYQRKLEKPVPAFGSDVWCLRHQRYEKMHFVKGASRPHDKEACTDIPSVGVLLDMLPVREIKNRPLVYCWIVEPVGNNCLGLTALTARCYSYSDGRTGQPRLTVARRTYRLVLSLATGHFTTWAEKSSALPLLPFADLQEELSQRELLTEYTPWEPKLHYCKRFAFHIPAVAARAAFDLAQEQLELACGRRRWIDTGRRDPYCLRDLIAFPWDMNLGLVLGFLGDGFLQKYSRTEQDVFSMVGRYLRLPLVKSIKRDYMKDRCYLIIYKILFTSGFTDLNIVRTLAKHIYEQSVEEKNGRRYCNRIFDTECAFITYDEEKDIVCATDYGKQFEDLRWYCRLIIKNKTEALLKRRLLENLQGRQGRGYRYFFDSLRMAKSNWENFSDSLQRAVIDNNPDRELHDYLTEEINAIQYGRRLNHDMLYENDNYTRTINGYAFRLVHNTKYLRRIGAKLHNCVASYADAVMDGRTKIVTAEKDGRLLACMEIDNDEELWQAKASCNERPAGELLQVIAYWSRLCGLRLDTWGDITEEDCQGWQEWGRDYLVGEAEGWK